MKFHEKYDKIITGAVAGLLLPFIVAAFVFVFAKGDPSPAAWLSRISSASVTTHVISLCVFPNIFIFLLFNYLDMLKASKGVLGITIAWALLVFAVKFLL